MIPHRHQQHLCRGGRVPEPLDSEPTEIIDFGERSLEQAQLYELPFGHVEKHVAPLRAINNDKHRLTFWWQHGRPASRAKAALGTLPAMIATPLTSKHRWFTLLSARQFPDNSLVVIARDDYTMLSLLSARFCVSWSLMQSNFLGAGNGPRYTPSTAFDTYPFPSCLTPDISTVERTSSAYGGRIADAARRICELRDAWLNPADLLGIVPGLAPGLPDRLKPLDADAAVILKKRTLTNLYNERPAWLTSAHRAFDEAVAAAYGWPAEVSDDDALRRLLALNRERATYLQISDWIREIGFDVGKMRPRSFKEQNEVPASPSRVPQQPRSIQGQPK